MANNRVLYLHLGLPKTGTTFLQEAVFPRIKSLDFYLKPKSPLFKGRYEWTGTLEWALKRSPMLWDTCGEQLATVILGPRQNILSDQRSTLISDEGAMVAYIDPVSIKYHLKALADIASKWGFSKTRVLISIRRQPTKLASAYAQVSDRCVGASQRDFEKRVRSILSPNDNYYGHSDPSHMFNLRGVSLDYKMLYDLVAEAVGKENVLLSPYEQMKDDVSGFLRTWLDFMEVPEAETTSLLHEVATKPETSKRNVRSKREGVWALRKRGDMDDAHIQLKPGRLYSKMGWSGRIYFRWPDLNRDKEIMLTPQLKKEILSTYESSNRQLAETVGLDLAQYGYF